MQGRFVYAPPVGFTMWTNAITTDSAYHGPPVNSLDRVPVLHSAYCFDDEDLPLCYVLRFLQGEYRCAVNIRVYPSGFMDINAHDRSRHDAIDETVEYNGNNKADRARRRTRGAAARN